MVAADASGLEAGGRRLTLDAPAGGARAKKLLVRSLVFVVMIWALGALLFVMMEPVTPMPFSVNEMPPSP